MLATDELNSAQWQIADAIARQLVIEGTDVNELRKATTYLRDRQDEPKAGKKFFDYLKTLVRHGDAIGHSKRTLGYYQSLDAVCSQYLDNYQDDAPRMLYILSWAARLMQYYDKGVPTGEITQPTVMSEREAELKAVNEANTFMVGQTLEAIVTAVRGNKVTYQLLGIIKLTQKKPKKAKEMTVGQKMKIEIIQLRDDGLPKKIKVLK
ncbi:hypothetical protein ACSYAD_21190 [Acaryochloris marina NIES-2412]|uniref:hypothetical protein n=1 Tax=Acaryochloris marina TaxID=155978 RepID=UPI00405A1D4A